MNNDYIKDKLGNIGKVCMCKRVLKKQTSSNGEIPFYKISTFGSYADSYISRELFNEYKSKFNYPNKGDILISAAGTLGKTVVFDGKDSYFQDSNIVWVDNDETKVLNDYLNYYYQLKPWIKTNGSTIERLYNDNLRNMEIVYPKDLKRQELLIKPLKLIDLKIENNKNMINELMDYSEDIFKYWFRQYKFPKINSITKKDFTKLKISEIEGNIITGKTPSTKNKENFDGKIPFITIDDIRDNYFITKTKRTLSVKGADSQKNKYLPEDSLCVSCIGTAGIIGFTTEISQTNQQINSIVCDNDYNKIFLYFSIKEYFEMANNVKVGNIFTNMNKDEFSSISVLYNEVVVRRFHEIVNPVFEQIKKLYLQNHELLELKKLLLPLIMNGKIKVVD